MISLIEELYPTNRGFVTDDYVYCLDYINEREIPLSYHTFYLWRGDRYSGVIPKKEC
jgi:hypothetical protein